jgi:hypothetical protein
MDVPHLGSMTVFFVIQIQKIEKCLVVARSSFLPY